MFYKLSTRGIATDLGKRKKSEFKTWGTIFRRIWGTLVYHSFIIRELKKRGLFYTKLHHYKQIRSEGSPILHISNLFHSFYSIPTSSFSPPTYKFIYFLIFLLLLFTWFSPPTYYSLSFLFIPPSHPPPPPPPISPVSLFSPSTFILFLLFLLLFLIILLLLLFPLFLYFLLPLLFSFFSFNSSFSSFSSYSYFPCFFIFSFHFYSLSFIFTPLSHHSPPTPISLVSLFSPSTFILFLFF